MAVESLWAVTLGGALSPGARRLQSLMSQRADRSRTDRESESERAKELRNERAVLYRSLLKLAHAAQMEAVDVEGNPMAMAAMVGIAGLGASPLDSLQQRLRELSAISNDIQITCSKTVRVAAMHLVNLIQKPGTRDHRAINLATIALTEAIRRERGIND